MSCNTARILDLQLQSHSLVVLVFNARNHALQHEAVQNLSVVLRSTRNSFSDVRLVSLTKGDSYMCCLAAGSSATSLDHSNCSNVNALPACNMVWFPVWEENSDDLRRTIWSYDITRSWNVSTPTRVASIVERTRLIQV